MDDPNSSLMAFNSSALQDETYDRRLTWGPWKIKGLLGTVNNIVACCYLALMVFFSFWPNQLRIEDPAQMNWAVLVTGGVAIFSVGYYLIYAKNSYKGPVVEVDPHVL